MIAVDLPGFGESPQEDFEPSPAGFAACLERWFAEQGLDRPHVAGNSMGGAIALELARRGAVASATGVSPAGFWNARELAFARRSLRASRAIVKRLRPRCPRSPARPPGASRSSRSSTGGRGACRPPRRSRRIDAFLDAPAFEPALDAFGPYRFRAGDALRGVPVTIAWGTRDPLLIPRQAMRARRLLPWAHHVALPGCGHVPFHDDPETVAAVLLAGEPRRG